MTSGPKFWIKRTNDDVLNRVVNVRLLLLCFVLSGCNESVLSGLILVTALSSLGPTEHASYLIILWFWFAVR